jgi:hypothetical protein
MKNVSPRYPTFVIHEGYDRALALESVNTGWQPLVDELFDFIEQQKINNVRIVQVKEKWGGLRVYTDMMHDKLDAKIADVQKRSFTICEVSGAAGKLRNCNGWYRTLSDVEGGQYPVVTQP